MNRTIARRTALSVAACLTLFANAVPLHASPTNTTSMQKIDLTPLHDAETPLSNPHKGWYHHYFDNGLNNYPSRDEDIIAVPGMNHVYLRLAWSFLEPERGKFNWKLLDDVIERFTSRGYGISFRITCKETDGAQKFATPEWVKNAGAQGRFVTMWDMETWRPNYDDPIFLKHLEEFHRAFAARYDGKPWVEYIDVGSYGLWGEGHNGNGDVPTETDIIKKHIALYQRCYKKSRLVISDDVVGQGPSERAQEMTDFVLQSGLSFRDDSPGVGWWNTHHAGGVKSPHLFAQSYKTRPTILELQHYGMMKSSDADHTWRGKDGAERGADWLEDAVRLTRASYIGYHGHADEWLRDNPNVTRRFANLVGYWYFLDSVAFPRALRAGQQTRAVFSWRNRGVAPAYHRYEARLRLVSVANPKRSRVLSLSSLDNRRWMPNETAHETATWRAPALPPGRYRAELGLFAGARPVRLAFKPAVATSDGFYRLGELTMLAPAPKTSRVAQRKR